MGEKRPKRKRTKKKERGRKRPERKRERKKEN
jgi:hypothetical protein